MYKIEVIFKEITFDGPLGKTKYYAIHIEFQERGSSPVYSFIWIFNAPNIKNEAVYTEFIEKTTNGQLPKHMSDQELFELVKTYQVHVHSRSSWKYNKNDCCFSCGCYFTEKAIITNLLDCKFSNDENTEVLTLRNTLLKQVKCYIDNNLYPAKVNLIDRVNIFC